ncbi:MAG: ethylbenzene dehydrogenase-related protein [Chloroflexota bacterium]|nr:ethylbenzene dehydrogenase-related protein [Chloroflexota bacterium]
MLAKRVAGSSESLLDPQAAQWQQTDEETVDLLPTPVELQASEYIQAVWPQRAHGLVAQVRVRSLHNGDSLFFRLEWQIARAVTEVSDIDVFADAAGVLFPVAGDAPLTEMGSPAQPVNAWFWRADLGEKPLSVTASGRGTSQRHVDNPLVSGSSWEAGTWRVVLGRPFTVAQPHRNSIGLKPGMTTKAAFVVLEGANNDRAGLKAYSPMWHELTIEG